MKRVMFGLITALVCVVAIPAHAHAQSAAIPTVDQILDKYVAALGGRAAMEKITSRQSTGTLEIPEAGLTGSMTISEKAPAKSLTVFELTGMGVIRDGSDGSVAWEDNPQAGGLRDKTGVELADALRGSTFNAELKMKSLYKTVTVSGKDKVGTRDAYVLVATPAEGAPNRMFFDVETGLLLQQSSSRETPQGAVDVDVFLEDYRDVQGLKQAFTIRQVTPTFSIVIRLSEVKYNVAMDDAMFKRPASPLAAR